MSRLLPRIARPIPMLWCVLAAVVVISPVALMLPANPFQLAPWVQGYADLVARIFPMIDRVVAYRHPNPELLRTYLAFVWTTVPFTLWLVWGHGARYTGPASWKPIGKGILELLLFLVAVAHFVWWPNLLPPFTGPIDPHLDERRRLFWSTAALVASGPLISMVVALLVDGAICTFRAGLKAFHATRSNT